MKKMILITLPLWVMLAAACRKSQGGDAAVAQTFYNSHAAEAARSKTVEYERPAPLTDRPEQILRRTGYITSYNKETRCPNWVAWHLTKAHTYGSHQRKNEIFAEDTEVTPRATDNDYYNSRYDRGHMCPAGDNKWDATAMRQSFLFTNICPQNHNLNKYEWNNLEILCRDWARRYGAIDIVCGPLYDSSSATKTIGRGKVSVPDGFFKVVMCRTGQPKAIGFLFKNDGKKVSLESVACTVDEVEQKTGIDFYPALDDKIERRIEAEANLSDW
ncbi:MAG: DNA/RNA non-specific endonuclease [Prevotella sp.]|nr:DNA/RNA non-specific endonuclease [Prevotella sp.]MBQ8488084.1 DNA/RNA non-specific endonuclease [Prevotella sp.]